MSAKRITLASAVLTEYKTGPDGRLTRCIMCHGEMAKNDLWLKMTRPGEYAIAAHASCMAREGHKLGGAVVADNRLGPDVPVGVRP